MKTRYRSWAATLGALVLALLCAPSSWAVCGVNQPAAPTHSSWYVQPGHAMLLRAALVNDDKDDDPSIVGFWHFKFLVGKSVFDGGYSQWHSDGTEITNSGSIPPWSSNFCLGVWKKVGVRKYELNHFAVSWDPTNLQATMPMGPANIRETVTMSPDGNEFSGTFSIVQYDNADNVLQQVQGTVTATRINVDTKASSIF